MLVDFLVSSECTAFPCKGQGVLEQCQAHNTGGNDLTSRIAGRHAFARVTCSGIVVSAIEGKIFRGES